MINRILASEIEKTPKSILLLGPRQVGKSTLIDTFDSDLQVNLADEVEYLKYASKPEELKNIISINNYKNIYIDEVQRLPSLLNTIQTIIDKNNKIKFYLTGSSARKIKRGQANLLPGRVLNYKMGPLVAAELNYKANSKKLLTFGALPGIYLEENLRLAEKLISSYAANYLKEEIRAEALTRNLESFSRFLQEAVLCNAQFIDFTKLSNRAKISRYAVPRYFEILEDTMLGYRIYPFSDLSESLDLIRHPKFFLFDTGVYNSLVGNFNASADRMGVLTEQTVFSQILHSSWAFDKNLEIFTFRTRQGVEVDFVIQMGQSFFGIEVKTNDQIETTDTDSLIFLKENFLARTSSKKMSLFVFHFGLKEKKLGEVWSLPWQKGLKELGL